MRTCVHTIIMIIHPQISTLGGTREEGRHTCVVLSTVLKQRSSKQKRDFSEGRKVLSEASPAA
jgi:hypothetical protein